MTYIGILMVGLILGFTYSPHPYLMGICVGGILGYFSVILFYIWKLK